MTASVSTSDRSVSDVHDPVALGSRRTEAVDLLLRKLGTKDGQWEIRTALGERLGEVELRRKKEQALRSLIPKDQPLFGNLLDAAILPETIDAVEETVRILEAAVEDGTSDDLMWRAMDLVLVLMSDASKGALSETRAPGEKGSGLEKPKKERSGAFETHTAPSAPEMSPGQRDAIRGYDPDGPFLIPDRVVRFGPFGETLAAPLFLPVPSERGPGAVRVISVLPAPPDTTDPELIRGWVRGVPAFSDSLAIRVGLLEQGDPGDLMEIEAEFHADPKSALSIYRAMPPISDGTADAAWCARLGRDIGRFGVTHEKAVETLSRVLGEHIRRGPIERYAPLSKAGAVLVVREALAEAVCGLIDAEMEFLEDGPLDVSGPDQNILGAFSPVCDLSRGRCLERALTFHFSAGVPLGNAMRQSLTEFRIAQALRENPDAPSEVLMRRFDLDAALPLSELCGRDPVIRIGLTEPALVLS